MAEPRLLGGQPLGLLGLRRDRLDLADLIGEEVELTLAIARRHRSRSRATVVAPNASNASR